MILAKSASGKSLYSNFHNSLRAKMAYAVNMAWKRKNSIDWKKMAPEIDNITEGTTIQWFAIDEYDLGSFAIYTSKEV